MIQLKEALIGRHNSKKADIRKTGSILVYPCGDDFETFNKMNKSKNCNEYRFGCFGEEVYLYIFDYEEFDTVMDNIKDGNTDVYVTDMDREKAFNLLDRNDVDPDNTNEMSRFFRKIEAYA